MIDLVTYKILKKGDFKMKKVTTLLLFIAISMLLVACSDKEKPQKISLLIIMKHGFLSTILKKTKQIEYFLNIIN